MGGVGWGGVGGGRYVMLLYVPLGEGVGGGDRGTMPLVKDLARL
jgi:hypothetical protein